MNNVFDDLKRMAVFAHVVESASFSGAADRLGIAKSAVSKHVTLLEQSVGARLLNRNTRNLSLTDVGEAYYHSCVRMLEAAAEAEQSIRPLQDSLQGTLRIASPVSFGVLHVAPLLHAFLEIHQSLKADLHLDDEIIDLVEEGIDVAIRVGWLQDSSLRAKKIGTAKRLVCASPSYLEKNGTPKTLGDLKNHEWIIFTLMPAPQHCTFRKKNEEKTIPIKGRIKANNGSAVRALALEGAGLATLGSFLVSEDIEQGRLVHLLPSYSISDIGIYAVYQGIYHQQNKVRKFIDYMAEHINF